MNSTRETQKKATTRYRAKKLDRVEIFMPKGFRDELKKHADEFQPQEGEAGKAGYSPAGSMNAFINRAIRETMKRDRAAADFVKSTKQELKQTRDELLQSISRDLEAAANAGIINPKRTQ